MRHEHVGIWIDHHRAMVVRLQEQSEPVITEINADHFEQDRRRESYSGRPSRNSWYHDVICGLDDKKQRIRERQKFYEEIGLQLQQADNVWIFGPGNTRQELLKYLINDGLIRINYDPTEAFTARASKAQIVDRVREHFTPPFPKTFHVGAGAPGREL